MQQLNRADGLILTNHERHVDGRGALRDDFDVDGIDSGEDAAGDTRLGPEPDTHDGHDGPAAGRGHVA